MKRRSLVSGTSSGRSGVSMQLVSSSPSPVAYTFPSGIGRRRRNQRNHGLDLRSWGHLLTAAVGPLRHRRSFGAGCRRRRVLLGSPAGDSSVTGSGSSGSPVSGGSLSSLTSLPSVSDIFLFHPQSSELVLASVALLPSDTLINSRQLVESPVSPVSRGGFFIFTSSRFLFIGGPCFQVCAIKAVDDERRFLHARPPLLLLL